MSRPNWVARVLPRFGGGGVDVSGESGDGDSLCAREPKSHRDAHRELLADEDLSRVLCLPEQRRLSNNLTLHYKRVLYVIMSTPASEDARGERVAIREHEDGSIHIEHRGVELPAAPFPKDAHALPGAIVDNKHLGHGAVNPLSGREASS
jgi:hypothetical protein